MAERARRVGVAGKLKPTEGLVGKALKDVQTANQQTVARAEAKAAKAEAKAKAKVNAIPNAAGNSQQPEQGPSDPKTDMAA